MRPHDPLGTSFYVSNDWVLPIYDVEVSCDIDNVQPFGTNGSTIGGFSMMRPPFNIEKVEGGGKISAPCNHAIAMRGPNNAAKARISVAISYRPFGAFWHRHVRFPMEAERTETGEWIWNYLGN
ncbi:MAG: hypothetical protein ACM3JB_10595 [Acidobacteriaceae bacterium]